jgi:hypothetical protein
MDDGRTALASAMVAGADLRTVFASHRTAKVRVFFGDRKYDFQLGLGELEELDELARVGPNVQLMRLQSGTWTLDDVRQPIRLGLVGGGLDKEAAYVLTERHVRPGYLADCAKIAAVVLMAATLGFEDEQLGELSAAEVPAKTAKTRKRAKTPSPAKTAD